MNDYEKLINIIRKQGAAYNGYSLQIGEMTSDTSCKIGDLKLNKNNLYVAEHLLYKLCYKVETVETKTTTESSTVSIPEGGGSHTHSHKYNSKIEDRSKYLQPLKKGDLVLLIHYNDSKFIIIEKLVTI